MTTKIYLIIDQIRGNDCEGHAITEDGAHLVSCETSTIAAQYDLGFEGTKHHKVYSNATNGKYELLWLGYDFDDHEGFQKAAQIANLVFKC